MHLPSIYFFFNDTATTEIYTLSLHDALPISPPALSRTSDRCSAPSTGPRTRRSAPRSEEHTSELQSRFDFVCRLLLDKKHLTNDRRRPIGERNDVQIQKQQSDGL